MLTSTNTTVTRAVPLRSAADRWQWGFKTPDSYLENSLRRSGRARFELDLIAQMLEASRQPVH
jgi:hypothetical protein